MVKTMAKPASSLTDYYYYTLKYNECQAFFKKIWGGQTLSPTGIFSGPWDI